MLYFAYGFAGSLFLSIPLAFFGIFKRSFRAGFTISMES